MRHRRDDDRFDAEVVRTVREAVATVVAEGLARLEEGQGVGGDYLRLVPTNPRAADLTVYLDYPTIAVGQGGHTTEMFGSQEKRLQELPKLIRAVIDGQFEWRYARATHRILFWRMRGMPKLEGTFYTEDGPWNFSRYGVGIEWPPEGALSGTYEPYRGRRERYAR